MNSQSFPLAWFARCLRSVNNYSPLPGAQLSPARTLSSSPHLQTLYLFLRLVGNFRLCWRMEHDAHGANRRCRHWWISCRILILARWSNRILLNAASRTWRIANKFLSAQMSLLLLLLPLAHCDLIISYSRPGGALNYAAEDVLTFWVEGWMGGWGLGSIHFKVDVFMCVCVCVYNYDGICLHVYMYVCIQRTRAYIQIAFQRKYFAISWRCTAG